MLSKISQVRFFSAKKQMFKRWKVSAGSAEQSRHAGWLPVWMYVWPSDESEFVRSFSPELEAICHWRDSLCVRDLLRSGNSDQRWPPETNSVPSLCHRGDLNSLTVWVTPLGGTPISHLEACLSLSLSLSMCVCICLSGVSVCLYNRICCFYSYNLLVTGSAKTLNWLKP